MNGLVISEGEKFYTDLRSVFDAISIDKCKEYNWLLTDYECYPQNDEIRELFSGKPVILSGEKITELLEQENFQWIWGVFSAFDKSVDDEKIFNQKLPFAEGNSDIWELPISIQHPLALMEIIAWDSSLTIVISRDDSVISSIQKSRVSAIALEKYINEE
ncbi:Protein of unknown function [Pseudobutyrivibrio sp. YE44]|uniref:DUF2691 family protein n=1 Tax=Pseudobutyrivibrio sp. YE44 TaxID=1520802 RepID=UPI00088510D1|nr:DUF2691 family protein [Pseudobutyrivibrio sp. YE44]SDB21043.1 Protein of unknown function [Pseudobutyrivibrio sp. YE44]